MSETDETVSQPPANFDIGDLVIDRDDDDPDVAVVVNTPEKAAGEWEVEPDLSLYEDNPAYDEGDAVVCVMFMDDMEEFDPEWRDRSNPYPLSEINESSKKFYAFPEPRLVLLADADVEKADLTTELASGTTADELTNSDAADNIADESSGEAREGEMREGEKKESDMSEDEPKEGETATETQNEEASDPGNDEETAPSPPELTDAAKELKARLEEGGMTVEVTESGDLHAEKLGESYVLQPGEVIEGDGVMRDRLEEVVNEYA